MNELRKNWAHRRAALGLTLQLAVMLAVFWGGSWLLFNLASLVYFQLELGRYWWVFLFKELFLHLLPVLRPVWSVGGTLLLTGWVFCKPLRYLDEVTEAAGRLARPGEDPIRLRPQLKTVQDQLNQAREQGLRAAAALRQEEQRKNDLIVYLAHDLKTPLTSVIGYLNLLVDEPQISPATRARYTGIALEKALRLEELVNEFFEITRFSLSHLELELSRVDLSLMLRQMVSEFSPELAEKRLDCRMELPPELPVRCDAAKLARVFDNLLRNAVSYGDPGTTLFVRGGLDGDMVELHFVNHGRTIPPEKLARIFEKFFRADESRASASGNAGLGLAIAKQIVEQHGGSIAAASADDQVEFTLRLPRNGPQKTGGY